MESVVVHFARRPIPYCCSLLTQFFLVVVCLLFSVRSFVQTVFDRRDSSVTWAPSHSRSIAARIEKERADRKVALAELEDDEDI